MDKNQQIALAIKNGDINRKNFITGKLKEDLKKNLLDVDNEKLEALFMEEVDSFIEAKIINNFYYHCLGNIRKKLEKESNINFQSNSLFTKDEMIILSLYLNIDNEILSSEKIAKKLGISIIDVTSTISKAKRYYLENREQINELFPNFVEVLDKRQNNSSKRKNLKTIRRQDIELIGYFTGQINDICIDIPELAKNYYYSPEAIKSQLKNFILSLKDKKIYSFLLNEYPNIEEMLVIRARTLELNPIDFLPKDIANKYNGEKSSKNKKVKMKKQSTKKSSNLVENKNKSKSYEKRANLYALFLQDVFTKREDGTYTPLKQLAKKYNISNQAVSARKKNYLRCMEKNRQLNQAVLKVYPTLYEDQSLYENSKSNKSNNYEVYDNVDEVVKFCKSIFQTRKYEFRLTFSSIAGLNNQDYSEFLTIKNYIFSKLEQDNDFKDKVLEKYPQLFDDKKEYEMDENKINYINIKEKINEYANILKAYYSENNDGSYNNLRDVSEKFGKSLGYINNKKQEILKMIENNKEIRDEILKLYPTLFEDKAIREAIAAHKKGKVNTIYSSLALSIATNYANFLMGIYHEEQNHIALDTHLNSLDCTMKDFLMKIRKISNLLSKEKYVRKHFNRIYPAFHEDMEKYMKEDKKLKDKILAVEKALKYVKLLKKIFTKNSKGTYSPNFDLATDLRELNFVNLKVAKVTILNEIDANEFLKSKVLELYPNFLGDRHDYEEYINKVNQIITTKKKKENTYSTVRTGRRSKISDLEFLKLILKKKEDGCYYSNTEIATILEYTEGCVCNRKSKILNVLENDDNFKGLVRKNYPNFSEDLEAYKKESKSGKRSRSVEEKYSEFLKLVYQKKEDGTYRNINEILSILNIHYNSFFTKRNIILKNIDSNPELKDKIVKIYPSFLDDMASYEEYQKYKLNEKECEIIDLLLTNKTKENITFDSVAQKLNISCSYAKMLEDKVLIKIESNPTLQEIYPSAITEATIRSNSTRKIISISSRDLDNIRVNSEKLENEKDSKSSLLKGINALEKSIYKEYVMLCDYKKKAMLALRLGFFNHTIFGSEDIANLFDVTVEEVDFLTSECLNLCIKKDKFGNEQKTIKKKM